MDVDELQHALGGIVLESAYLERVLRTAFSALVGSKYSAVIDSRMTASSLIEDCEQIAKHHTAIAQPAKETLLAALRTCHEVNRARNRAIHDAWVTRPGEMAVTPRDGRRARDVTVTAQMLATLAGRRDRSGGRDAGRGPAEVLG